MPTQVFTGFVFALGEGNIDLTTALAGGNLRMLLVMTNSTAEAERDDTFIADITTLDEFDGAGYARETLTGTYSQDDAGNQALLSIDPATFGTPANGTRMIAGAILFLFVTNDADSRLIAFFPVTPYNPDGNPVIFEENNLNKILRIRALPEE